MSRENSLPVAWVWLLPALLLILLPGCRSLDLQPLPTLAPTAEPPGTVVTIPDSRTVARDPVPVTFTPESVSLQAGITTRAVTPTPEPTATPLPSATPLIIAAASSKLANISFRAAPPETVPCGDEGLTFRATTPGKDIAYHAYLPPCYGLEDRAYPVLYLIHGSIQNDSHWLDLGLAEYADAGISSGRYPPFIAIMPYSGALGNITSGGPKSIEGNYIDDVIPAIDSLYCTWDEAAGRSIGGISRGGYWALEIAFRYPELFGAVSGHSSHLRYETDPARYNPLSTYDTADLAQTRIWLDRGEKDFLRVGQDQLHERLTSAGIPHEYRVNPGGHSDAYWAQHLPEYLDWHLALWPRAGDAYPSCP